MNDNDAMMLANKAPVVELEKHNGSILPTGLDAQARVYRTHRGTVLKLLPVSFHATQRILTDPRDKPRIPTIKVPYGDPANPVYGEEANPNDPIYVDELARWKTNQEYKMMMYAYGTGVQIEVPEDYIATQLEFFPYATPNELKYLYITALLDADEYIPLLHALTGQNAPDEEGVQKAQAEFQRPS